MHRYLSLILSQLPTTEVVGLLPPIFMKGEKGTLLLSIDVEHQAQFNMTQNRHFKAIHDNSDLIAEQHLKENSCIFEVPIRVKIIDLDHNEEIVAMLCGTLIPSDVLKEVAPDILFEQFDNIDQATYELYRHEIYDKENTAGNIFYLRPDGIMCCLEYREHLELFLQLFREYILHRTGYSADVFYGFTRYQSKECNEHKLFALDNNDFPGFELVAPKSDSDPGLFCRRRFVHMRENESKKDRVCDEIAARFDEYYA